MSKKTEQRYPVRGAALPQYSQEEANKIGEQLQLLDDQAREQVRSYRLWLGNAIRGLQPGQFKIMPDHHLLLIRQVDQVKMEVVRMDRLDGDPSVSIVVEYPDELHDFLSRPEVGSRLNIAALGGITLPSVDAVTEFTRTKPS